MLSIHNFFKRYGTRTILDNVSLEVKKGEIALLLGSSGVGKSTLLRILGGLETFDAGNFTCDGRVGMVFQQFNLFENMTAEYNIAFPLEKVANLKPEEARAQAHGLLKKYGLLEKKACYPQDLSGGQKQRLAIARTVALKPHVICMDEPTSALDPLLTTAVANSISELADEGYVVLVATHDTALLQKLDATIYLMEQGKIVESATTRDFNAAPATFSSIKKFIEG